MFVLIGNHYVYWTKCGYDCSGYSLLVPLILTGPGKGEPQKGDAQGVIFKPLGSREWYSVCLCIMSLCLLNLFQSCCSHDFMIGSPYRYPPFRASDIRRAAQACVWRYTVHLYMLLTRTRLQRICTCNWLLRLVYLLSGTREIPGRLFGNVVSRKG